ncbi:hypothetical protein M5L40_003631 [Clostridium botulinum]|nr:hypothetical protein [Clostridium botulinum]
MKILKEYIKDSMIIREISMDGKTISHIVHTPIEKETEGDVIELPKNPILKLKEENEQLKKQLDDTQKSMAEMMNLIAMQGITP